MKLDSKLKRFEILSAALFLALGASTLFAGEDWLPQPIGPFGTLNNRDNSFAIPAEKAQDLLNVDLTQGGKSVRKRHGYGLAFTTAITSAPIHGTYNFYDANGNDVSLIFNDTRISASVNGGSLSVLSASGTYGATYQCTDSLGFAYCDSTARTTLVKTNGSTYANISTVASTGTMVAACPTRLAQSGFADAPSRIDFSADTDFTTWGSGPLGTSACQFTVNAPGAKITHITYAFGRLMWFKDTSFGYVLLGNQPAQGDWVVRTVSYDVGTNDNTSVYREGMLYFRGKDAHIYEFDGSNYKRSTREIAATVNVSQTRAANSWTQTSQTDFQSGISSPTNNLSTTINPGNVVLSTTTAIASFSDTALSDFQAGTLTNVEVTTSTGSVKLSLASGTTQQQQSSSGNQQYIDRTLGALNMSQQFVPTSDYFLSGISMGLIKVGSPTDLTVDIYSDSSNRPGSSLISGTITGSSVGTTETPITLNFSSTITLTAGTSYWIFPSFAGAVSDANTFLWTYSTAGSPYSAFATTWTFNSTLGQYQPSYVQTLAYRYGILGSTYNATGNIVSRSFDTGFTTATWLWDWSTFSATGSIPAGTSITYETQTATGTNGPWNTLVSVSSGSSPTSSVQEFIRYKATLAGTSVTTPRLDDVAIAMSSRLKPSGTFYSQLNNVPNITSWDSFSANTQGTTHSFFIRASTGIFSLLSSTPAWTAITLGAIPTISTGVYLQIKDQIAATSAASNPTLNDFTINWFEGSASDKAYATYFDDKILWSVTSGTGATTNNRTLVYDLLNEGWLLYDFPSNGFFVRQNHLYFGSATGGYVYKYGDVENDNGSAINAYWKSKDFFGGNPFTTQEISNISVSAKSVAASSMTITYTLNGSSSTAYTMNLSNSSTAFLNKNKNLPAGTVASEYSVKFGNNAADQSFEVFGLQVGIRPRTWVPTP